MITINRTFDNETGLLGVENLSGVIFSPESYAHEFVIARADGSEWPGTATARFVRADGVTVFIEGTVNQEDFLTLSVVLPPECYQVPGPFGLFIFNYMADVGNGNVIAVYAGRGTVLQADTDQTIIDPGTVANFESQMERIMELCFADSTSLSRLMATYAVNISEVESELASFLEQSNRIENALAEAGVEILSGPNMIAPEDFYTTVIVENVSTTKIYGQTNRIYAYGKPYIRNATNEIPATSGSDPDEISEAITTLSPTITDADGSEYTKGIAFTVTNPPTNGYNNADELIYIYGNHGAGEPPVNESGNLDLVVGHVYTMSCWARVTSGTEMRLEFSYSPTDYKGESTYIDISGSAWRRVSWQFTFNPTGDQYYNYTVYTDGNGNYSTEQEGEYQTAVSRRSANWTKTVGFGVCRKFAGTVELCGFRLVAGNNYMRSRVDDLEDGQEALESEVSDIVSAITPNVETSMTATAAYSAGDIIAVGAKLYQATAAIASGDTLAVGTNIAAITLVDYIAQVTS